MLEIVIDAVIIAVAGVLGWPWMQFVGNALPEEIGPSWDWVLFGLIMFAYGMGFSLVIHVVNLLLNHVHINIDIGVH